jgi:adenylate cyclase
VLISYETFAHAKDEIVCEERGEVRVKGIAYPVATYEVVDLKTNVDAHHRTVQAEQPYLQLRMMPERMSAAERQEAATTLRRALGMVDDQGAAS